MSSANSIKVVARFRPQNKIEIESGGQPIVRFDGQDTCTVDVSSLLLLLLLLLFLLLLPPPPPPASYHPMPLSLAEGADGATVASPVC